MKISVVFVDGHSVVLAGIFSHTQYGTESMLGYEHAEFKRDGHPQSLVSHLTTMISSPKTQQSMPIRSNFLESRSNIMNSAKFLFISNVGRSQNYTKMFITPRRRKGEARPPRSDACQQRQGSQRRDQETMTPIESPHGPRRFTTVFFIHGISKDL